MAKAASDWIEWTGGKMPVSKMAIVQVRYHSGHETGPSEAWNFEWIAEGLGDFDTVAYRPVGRS